MAALAYRKAYPYRTPHKMYNGEPLTIASGKRKIVPVGSVRTTTLSR